MDGLENERGPALKTNELIEEGHNEYLRAKMIYVIADYVARGNLHSYFNVIADDKDAIIEDPDRLAKYCTDDGAVTDIFQDIWTEIHKEVAKQAEIIQKKLIPEFEKEYNENE